ncbi:PH domain-containing protein [Propionibacteriaceae bacterium Y1923]|uniref:PH domain-containing protein n=1 Tax=Aestuariimicrobium sp. Y1814 TaxID=3418742 RepID=UPI003C2268DF
MGFDPRLLGDGERVVRHMRTHGKALILPAMWLILLAAVVGLGLGYMPESWNPWGSIALGVVALVVFIALVLRPFLQWYTTTYTMTDRRIITRRGVFSKTGHDLPLRRINNVSYERSLTDRLLGCGSLVFTTAAETPVTLPDVPDVERVHVQMTELLFGSAEEAEIERDE